MSHRLHYLKELSHLCLLKSIMFIQQFLALRKLKKKTWFVQLITYNLLI